MSLNKGDIISLKKLKQLGDEIAKLDETDFSSLHQAWEAINQSESSIEDELSTLEALACIAAAPEETQRTTSPRETPRGFLLEGWQWVPI